MMQRAVVTRNGQDYETLSMFDVTFPSMKEAQAFHNYCRKDPAYDEEVFSAHIIETTPPRVHMVARVFEDPEEFDVWVRATLEIAESAYDAQFKSYSFSLRQAPPTIEAKLESTAIVHIKAPIETGKEAKEIVLTEEQRMEMEKIHNIL